METPFVNDIINTPYQQDGRTCPSISTMGLQIPPSTSTPTVFSTSLKGDVLNRYTRLLPRLVDSFKMLVEKFKAQYVTCRPHHLMLVALVNLKQEEDESFHSFMERFATVIVKIRDLNLEVALHSMIMALKSGMFSNNLCKKPPTPMDELRARTSGYIQMKEMVKY
ncbi:hypothetical protein CR513_33738, partial [Mucuna pruriens]